MKRGKHYTASELRCIFRNAGVLNDPHVDAKAMILGVPMASVLNLAVDRDLPAKSWQRQIREWIRNGVHLRADVVADPDPERKPGELREGDRVYASGPVGWCIGKLRNIYRSAFEDKCMIDPEAGSRGSEQPYDSLLSECRRILDRDPVEGDEVVRTHNPHMGEVSRVTEVIAAAFLCHTDNNDCHSFTFCAVLEPRADTAEPESTTTITDAMKPEQAELPLDDIVLSRVSYDPEPRIIAFVDFDNDEGVKLRRIGSHLGSITADELIEWGKKTSPSDCFVLSISEDHGQCN